MRTIPIGLLLAVVALVSLGGAALALGRTDVDPETRADLFEKAANRLGVTASDLDSAFQQAVTTQELERAGTILDALVADDVISGEQAEEALDWLGMKPASIGSLASRGALLRIATIQGVHTPRIQPIGPEFDGEIIEKMSEILGIGPDELKDAFQGAGEDAEAERRAKLIDELIAGLVEDGEITMSEGEEIKGWIEAMPAWLADGKMLARILGHALAYDEISPGFGLGPLLEQFRFLPGGHEFKGPNPGFEFHDSDVPRERFFFRGPGRSGEGELPDELESLFERLRDRFEGDFEGFDGFEWFSPGLPHEGVPPSPDPGDEEMATPVPARSA